MLRRTATLNYGSFGERFFYEKRWSISEKSEKGGSNGEN